MHQGIRAHGHVARQGKDYSQNYKTTRPCKAYMSCGEGRWLGEGRIVQVVKHMELQPPKKGRGDRGDIRCPTALVTALMQWTRLFPTWFPEARMVAGF
jgi:hypothetical protein